MKQSLIERQAWYKKLMRYPIRYNFYATLLLILGMVTAWQILLYRPLNRSITYYNKKNNDFLIQRTELVKAEEQCADLLKSIHGYERDLKGLQETPVDPQDFLAYTVNQSVQARLSLGSCILQPVMDYGWHQMQALCIDVQGSLNDVAQWLKIVSDKSRLVSIGSLNINQLDNELVRCIATINCLHVRHID